MLPLHCEAKGAQKGKGFHAGLWYDRFFNQYDHDCKVGDDSKINWIKTVAGETGDTEKLQAFAERQQVLLEACGGQSLAMSTDWHFVTGMGNNHPVENGFAWHHTLGVPYLTGAAVKGMVRAWCEVWEGFNEEKIKQWFGDTEQSGELIFFDAAPTAPVKLKADIMTPHYKDWYAKGDDAPMRDGSNVPADWHDPVPVPFLVVDKGAAFQFGVAKRVGSDIDLSEVVEALSAALQWLGAGAKTAAGYGRFGEDQQAKAKREKQMRERELVAQQEEEQRRLTAQAEAQGLTGLAIELTTLVEQKGLKHDKSSWVREAPALIEQVLAHGDAEERLACKKILLELCDQHDAGITSNPDKTKGKKNKPVYKSGVIQIAKTVLGMK